MPIRPLIFLTALVHAYIGLRLVPGLSMWWPTGLLLACVLLVSAVALPMPFLHRLNKKPLGNGWQWLGLLAMGWFSSLALATLLRDLVLGLYWAASWSHGTPGSNGQPGLSQWTALGAVGMATAASLIGFIGARRTARVRHIDIPMPGLPSALQGFSLVQLSDLHVGPTIRRRYIERIVQRVNGLKADAVVITGDLVDGSVSALRSHIEPLAHLQSRHGTFVVTGNHEYYAGAHAWIAELRRMGLRVLMNEHVLLRPVPGATDIVGKSTGAPGATPSASDDADALVLAGVTDFHAGHFDAAHESDPVQSLKGAPAAATARVLLAHQPRSAPAAADAGFQLQLSGHTHGGQFWPWNLFVPLQQPFVSGLHRVKSMWIYVSRGTGYWGPPKRLGAPSEITLVRLVRAA